MFDPATIDPNSLPSVPIQNRWHLPNCPAVYFVLSSDNTLLYVGRSISLRYRWTSHSIVEVLRARDGIRIAWQEISDSDLLPTIEKILIEHFQPLMNRETIALNGVSEYGAGRPHRVLSLPLSEEEREFIIDLKSSLQKRRKTLKAYVFEALREKMAKEDKKK